MAQYWSALLVIVECTDDCTYAYRENKLPCAASCFSHDACQLRTCYTRSRLYMSSRVSNDACTQDKSVRYVQ
jgi:hypothetical protein